MKSALNCALAAAAITLIGCPMTASAAQAPPRFAVPHFNFVRLWVADTPKAVAFYVKGLGLHDRGQVSPIEVFVGVNDDPTSTALNLTQRKAGEPQPAGANLSFAVTGGMDAAIAKVVAAGGKLVTPTRRFTQPDVLIDIAYVDDLDGNHIELMDYVRIGPPK